MSEEHTLEELHARQCRSERRERMLLGLGMCILGVLAGGGINARRRLANGLGLLGIHFPQDAKPTIEEMLGEIETSIGGGWDAIPEPELAAPPLQDPGPLPGL